MNSAVIVTVLLQAYMYHINIISLEYKQMSQIMARTNKRILLSAKAKAKQSKAKEVLDESAGHSLYAL